MLVPVGYSRSGGFVVARPDLLAELRSAYRMKLSIHGRGFVQFSKVDMQGVLSGRDPATDRPRSLGYETWLVRNPPTYRTYVRDGRVGRGDLSGAC